MKNDTPSRVIISFKNVDQGDSLARAFVEWVKRAGAGGDAAILIGDGHGGVGKESRGVVCGAVGHDVNIKLTDIVHEIGTQIEKAHTREFLEEMVAETRRYVPKWLYASLLKEARSRSGGRARHRSLKMSPIEKLALSVIDEDRIKTSTDSDLAIIWNSIQTWYTAALKQKESVEPIMQAGDLVHQEMSKRKLKTKKTPLLVALEEIANVAKADVDPSGPMNAPVAFVGASLEPLEKARGEQFVGDTGLCFVKKYLEPLGLKREDVYLTSLIPKVDFAVNTEVWTKEQIKKLRDASPLVVVALSQEVGRGLGDLADFTLPHPAIVSRHDSGEVARKLKRIKQLVEDRQAPPIRITKADNIKHIVYGVVLDPYGANGPEVDAHNDWNPPASVEAAAHNFAKGEMVVGLQHKKRAKAKVVETWVEQYPSRSDYLAAMQNKPHSVFAREFGDEMVHSGSWLMGAELGPVEWGLFEKGEITGFSPGGFGNRTPMKKSDMPKVKIVELVKKVSK